jgi:hypothetical protein
VYSRLLLTKSVSLTPGARLGAYEVVARIGAGGMGEVTEAILTVGPVLT